MFINAPRYYLPAIAALLAVLCGCSAEMKKDSPHSGSVMNYHRVNERLVTGGHLLEGGTAALQVEGVKVVIDLRDEPPSGEQERYAEQGIEWINIPVVWNDPQRADFELFSATMSEHQSEHVLVQCAANYRASAMTYLYRVTVGNVSEGDAEKDLYAVWDPNENDTWRDYISTMKSVNLRKTN
jgi:protein tyrosine phosphatase (PTP) superfamily phosphohydrolase (DUF442 family)